MVLPLILKLGELMVSTPEEIVGATTACTVPYDPVEYGVTAVADDQYKSRWKAPQSTVVIVLEVYFVVPSRNAMKLFPGTSAISYALESTWYSARPFALDVTL